MTFDLLGHPEFWTALKRDAMLLLPEIILVCGMCAVILAPFIMRKSRVVPAAVTIVTLLAAMAAVLCNLRGGEATSAFAGMVAIDPFSQFFKLILCTFAILVVALWLIVTKRHTHEMDAPDLFCLILGAATGMALMSSASNLLMIFIATESASIPSYALAGFRKRLRIGSEGSLKYVIFGAASTAITLYGMSLIYGAAGTLRLDGIATVATQGVSPLMAIGLLAMFAGVAFKLSAVPMHFWCPDVFQGAPIEITTFLSVASKGGAICMLVRIVDAFSGIAVEGSLIGTGLAIAVGILGAVTATWGNLAALAQTNVKRLLAYSSIAHAGYMIMGAAAAVTGHPDIAAAILFYLLVYMFMNLGAFTVAAIIAEPSGGDSEEIADYTGLSRRSPALAVLMSLFLLSLFGMPGLGGFLGKIALMKAMITLGPGGFALLAVLLLNTLVSLYYYMRPIYYMYLARDEQARPAFVPSGAGVALLGLCALGVLWTGLTGMGISLADAFGTLTGSQTQQTALIEQGGQR